MNLPNYRRRALEYFRGHEPIQRDERLRAVCQLFAQSLGDASARSFILPTDGEMIRFDTPCSLSFGDMHLPFQKCILEFAVSRKDVPTDRYCPAASVIIAEQLGDGGIVMSSAWLFGESWSGFPLSINFFEKTTVDVSDDGTVRVNDCRPGIAHSGFKGQIDLQEQAENMIDEIRVLAHFALLCGCENVAPAKIHSPDQSQQHRARQRGRAPFNDYYVLDISLPSGADQRDDGAGGRHGVRFHVRRGHIRRLHSGRRTWVRQCTVGDPSLGTVNKDYRVRSPDQPEGGQ